MKACSFPKQLMQDLACDDFVNAPNREEWAKNKGHHRPITPQLMFAVERALRCRKDNKRLGLPDPLR